MPRGITQDQVNQAADAIVAAGERPTVEKIRNLLGTGSPNTVTRMLEVWRQGLAERLRDANLLPNLPDEVGQAMSTVWTLAIQHARGHMQNEFQAERDALQQSQTALEEREAEQAAQFASAREDAQRSEEAARRATTQSEALQRLVSRLETELQDQSQERTRLLAQNQALETTTSRLRDEIRATEEKSANDRAAWDKHIKVVEDRAHAQVDSTRLDLKAARTEFAEAARRHRKEVLALQQQIESLTRALGAAERDAAHHSGVAEALKLKLSPEDRTRVHSPRKRRSNTDRSRPSQKRRSRKHLK